MQYVHDLGERTSIESDSTSFLLPRKAGGYLSFGLPNKSHYQGLCTILPWNSGWEMVKTIESISLSTQPHTITLLADSAERDHATAKESFTVHEGAVTWSVRNYQGPITLTLDMRLIHDFDQSNRQYSIQDVPGGHIITYSCPRYTLCLAIIGARATFKQQWKEAQYVFDAQRGQAASQWVNECLQYTSNGSLSLRFGVGTTPAAALQQAGLVGAQHHTLSLASSDPALLAALAALDAFVVDLPQIGVGMFAGYPWFFQVWTRDEAISVGALQALGEHTLAKQILLRQLQYVLGDGRIPNRFPASDIGSADGIGWTATRLARSLHTCSVHEKIFILSKLRGSLSKLKESMLNGLLHTGAQETWMDTLGGTNDSRAGARIEIQALLYRMLTLAHDLSLSLRDGDAEIFRSEAQALRTAVHTRLFDGKRLADGMLGDSVDWTSRPNALLAHSIAPELFSTREWQSIASHALHTLWLPWGGLATIDTHHPLYCKYTTGVNDKSYHRGDSWYWINNLAAMSLAELGYGSQAEQILAASRRQILSIGIPGHAAETSSAAEQQANGCWSQTWSAATFVEAALGLQRQS